MGYSHYFTPKTATEEKFNEFVDVCKKLHKALPSDIKICSGNGSGKPEFAKKQVCFNGDGDQDLDHEALLILKEDGDWDFCKTTRKPYDLLVCASLIAAHEILGYEITSDGRFDEWKEGIQFYMKTRYAEMVDDQECLETILPTFLFEGEGGDEYEKPYNVFDYVKTLFVVVE